MSDRQMKLSLVITAQGAEAEKELKRVERDLESLGATGAKQTTALESLKGALGALLGGAALAGLYQRIKDINLEAAEWEKRELRTAALVRATGNAAGFAAKELMAYAEQLDLATLGDKEGILDGINVMQTFRSMTGDTFKRAIRGAQDLAAVFGGDLRSSAAQIGKALEDPIQGINALRRSGVSFTEDQKAMIAALVETGDKASAQTLILAELEKQVGGAASAEAGGLAGAVDTLSFNWRKLREELADTSAAKTEVDGLAKGVGELAQTVRDLKSLGNWFSGAAMGAATGYGEDDLATAREVQAAMNGVGQAAAEAQADVTGLAAAEEALGQKTEDAAAAGNRAMTALKEKQAAEEALKQTQKARLALEREGQALTAALMTDDEKRAAAQGRYTELLRAHIITVETYRRALATPFKSGFKSETDGFEKQLEQMQFEASLITATNTEREIAIKLRELEMSGVNKASAAYQNLAEGFKKVITYKNALQELKDFSFATDQMTFSDSLTSGISSAVKAFERLNHVYDEQAEALKRIKKAREEANKVEDPKQKARDLEFINRREQELTSDSISYQLSAYGQMFGTLGQLYDEDSKERRRLNEAEKAFAMAQIAIQAQQAITSAVASIASAGTGDPYTAIPRVLAMAALMAGVLGSAGIAFSGGGGGGSAAAAAAPQGSGTVLGDPEALSQSASKSYDLLEEFHTEEYAALRGIWSEMKDLNTNITGLVNSIVRSFDTSGVSVPSTSVTGPASWASSFNNFQRDIGGDQLFDLMTTGGLNVIQDLFGGTPFSNAFGDFVNKWWDGVASGLSSVLGGEVSYKLMESGIAVGEITIASLQEGVDAVVQEYAYIRKKKSGGWFSSSSKKYFYEYAEANEDVTALFTAVFSDLGNSLVTLTEGLGGDIQTALDYAFSAVNINLKDMDAGEISETISAVISAAGDEAAGAILGDIIRRYQQIDEGLLETATRLYATQEVVRAVLAQSGIEIETGLLAISQSLTDLAGGLEALQESYAGYYDKFYTDQEKLADQYDYLSASLAQLNLEMPDSREGFRALVEAQDVTTESGQRAYVALLGLSEVADSLATAAEEAAEAERARVAAIREETDTLQMQILELTDADAALTAKRQQELDALTGTNKFLQLRIWQLQEEKAATENLTTARAAYRSAAEAELQKAQAAQQELESAFAAAGQNLEAAKNALAAVREQNREQARRDLVQGRIDLINEEIQAQQSALSAAQARISKWSGIAEQLREYQAGMLTGPNTYLLPDRVLTEAQRQFNTASPENLTGAADTLLEAARNALTDPRAYEAIFGQVQGKIGGAIFTADRQVAAAERAASAAERQIAELQAQSEVLNESIQATGTTVSNIWELQKEYAAALNTYNEAKTALDESTFEAEITYWQGELDRLDIIIGATDALTEAVGNYQSALVRAIDGGYQNMREEYRNELHALTEGRGYAAGGIATGPDTGYLATLHGTEAIIPLQNGSVPVRIQGAADAETKELLRDLLTEIRADGATNKKIHRLLDRVTGGADSLQTRVSA